MAPLSQARGTGSLTVTISVPSVRDCAITLASPGIKSLSLLSRTCPDPPCRVRDGLFIGSKETESSHGVLAAAGITHVLQVGGELTPSHEGLSYHRLSLSDEECEDLVGALGPGFSFITEGRRAGAVLVHCAQGMSRSVAVVAAYLMWAEHLSAADALAALRTARPIADPNQGFLLQLNEFERRACRLDDWAGWGRDALAASLRRSSASGRRVLRQYSELVRCFHCHSVDDDDTVFRGDAILEL